jgi:hypothetical protein
VTDVVRAKDCPGCGLHWADDRIETISLADSGGSGYRRRCDRCGKEWYDSIYSHGLKHTFRSTQPVESPPLLAVDCCNPEHWFDSFVGWPGRHDGGLPDVPSTPCQTFEDAYNNGRKL